MSQFNTYPGPKILKLCKVCNKAMAVDIEHQNADVYHEQCIMKATEHLRDRKPLPAK